MIIIIFAFLMPGANMYKIFQRLCVKVISKTEVMQIAESAFAGWYIVTAYLNFSPFYL